MTTPVVELAFEKLSHSQRTSWLRCANQYRLERAGYPVRPSMSLVAGKSFHSSCDTVDYALWNGDTLTEADCESFWHANLTHQADKAREVEADPSKWAIAGRRTKEKPNKEDLVWWTENGGDMVNGYREARELERSVGLDIWELPDGEPAIEVPVSIEFPDTDPPMRIRCYIDRIMQQHESLLVRDLKTSQREPEEQTQLGIYRLAFEGCFGLTVEWGDYFMAREKAASTPVSLSHYTKELLAQEYGFIARAKRDKIYPANPGQACRTCAVIDACAIKGGSEADLWASALPR